MFGFLTPHYRIASVLELTPERLRELGLESLLLDADCTLKRYRSAQCAPGVAEWLDALRQAGFGLCLVSNGLGERIGRFAEPLGLPFVAKALKPLPIGCRRAMRKMGFRRQSTAMVGDQLFADILAGRLAGLTTFLVDRSIRRRSRGSRGSNAARSAGCCDSRHTPCAAKCCPDCHETATGVAVRTAHGVCRYFALDIWPLQGRIDRAGSGRKCRAKGNVRSLIGGSLCVYGPSPRSFLSSAPGGAVTRSSRFSSP